MKAKRSSIELMVLSFVLLIARAFGHDVVESDGAIVMTDGSAKKDIMSAFVSNDNSDRPEKLDNVDLKTLDLLTTWKGNQ